MILFPFGFLTSGGSSPNNVLAPTISIVEDLLLEYVPGTWDNADSVTFAWWMNGVLQSESGTEFTAEFDQNVVVIETAVNEFGETTSTSNGISIPSPTYYDTGSMNWNYRAGSLDSLSLLVDPTTEDTGNVSWNYLAHSLDSSDIANPGDNAQFNWEVFGSVV